MAEPHTRKPRVVKEMPSVALDREEFERRLRRRHEDPLFEGVDEELEAVIEAAWRSYSEHHKAPRTRKAGPEFADPGYDLSLDWLAARDGIRYRRDAAPRLDAAPRGDPRHQRLGPARTNPAPVSSSKTYRLAKLAQGAIESWAPSVDFLDLSVLTSEYGRVIYPCKSCVSTAMPRRNWPCSCYPNHGLGQTQDWMNELYPRWVAAPAVRF